MKPSNQRYEFPSLYVHSQTWNRDSHGLFDYESESIVPHYYETKVTGSVVRTNDEVSFIPGLQSSASGDRELLSIERAEDVASGFIIRPKPRAEDVWLVVRYLEAKSHILTKDLVLKLGRVRYRVREVASDDLQATSSDTASSDEGAEVVQGDREDACCRICYDRESDGNNPLLSPCKCEGSVKFTHLQCLKQWLSSKVMTRPSESSITYQWKSLECEICKTELPLTLKTKGMQRALFDFEKPQRPYIVLEGSPSEHTAAKSMHVISIGGKTSVKLGRGHDSDVRINDISVSRCHAVVHYENGVFRLEDNSSKFGTLVKVCDPLPITSRVVLQTGRTLLTLEPRLTQMKGDVRKISPTELDLAKSL